MSVGVVGLGGRSVLAAVLGLLAPLLPPSGSPWPVAELGGVRLPLAFSVRGAGGGEMMVAPEAQTMCDGVVSFTVGDRLGAVKVSVTLATQRGERFYGLGERFTGPDLTGQVAEVWTEDPMAHPGRRTSYAPAPFLLSSRGYGLLLDTTARSIFDVGASTRHVVKIRVAASGLRALLLTGPHPRTVLERRARLGGLPPLPPPWAFGVWKNLIGGEERVEAELERLRQLDIPVDAVCQPVGWDTDAETVAVFRAYARLHRALVPYLYGHARVAHERGIPILRPLFVDFPGEADGYGLDDEYLLGDDLLVAPVVDPGRVDRRLYVPTGWWREYWTGQDHYGPAWVTVDAPVHLLPLLVRVGAEPGLPDPDELRRPPSGSAVVGVSPAR